MATNAKTRHRRLEARRARRRYRAELCEPAAEKKRRDRRKRELVEEGAVQHTRFFLLIGKWQRAYTKAGREERAKRDKDRLCTRRRPLTKRYLELVELSATQAERLGRARAWLPVDAKRAEGRLKRLLARRKTREQRFEKSGAGSRFRFPPPREADTLMGTLGA